MRPHDNFLLFNYLEVCLPWQEICVALLTTSFLTKKTIPPGKYACKYVIEKYNKVMSNLRRYKKITLFDFNLLEPEFYI